MSLRRNCTKVHLMAPSSAGGSSGADERAPLLRPLLQLIFVAGDVPPWWFLALLLSSYDEKIVTARGRYCSDEKCLPPNGFIHEISATHNKLLECTRTKRVIGESIKKLLTGDTIMIADSDKSYYIIIVETKPSNTVSIIQTDCPVDFAPLSIIMNMKHQQHVYLETFQYSKIQNRFIGMGIAKRLDGKPQNYRFHLKLETPRALCQIGVQPLSLQAVSFLVPK